MQRNAVGAETGCTVGVVHIPGGILFFKNRDLERRHLVEKRVVFTSTRDFHALQGINFETGEPEGVSIGVSKHKICVANTHVASTEDATYDLLCEELLRQARDSNDVRRIVVGFMRRNAVQGGRILVSSPDWTFLVEVYRKEFRIREIETDTVMTNSFTLIPADVQMPAVWKQSSGVRLDVAGRMMRDIRDVGGLEDMLRSHVPEKGELSICNHRGDGGGTESSHIIRIQGDNIAWSSVDGHPCENDYTTVRLELGNPERSEEENEHDRKSH